MGRTEPARASPNDTPPIPPERQDKTLEVIRLPFIALFRNAVELSI